MVSEPAPALPERIRPASADRAESEESFPTRGQLRRMSPPNPPPHEAVREGGRALSRREEVHSYRPTVQQMPLRRLDLFRPLARARARLGVVIVTARAGTQEISLKRPPTVGELFRSGGGTKYEVDTGLHHTSTAFELPTADKTVTFRAIANIEWRVCLPARVVEDGLTDVRAALRPVLRSQLSSVTRKFAPGNTSGAERAIVDNLATSTNPGSRYGLDVRIAIRLQADRGSAEHAVARLDLERKVEIEDLRHDHQRKQDEHEHTLLEARLGMYREIITNGDVDQFALQLARNPDDVRTVVQLVRESQNEERRLYTDFLKHLLDSGAIDRWEIEDHVRSALDWLDDVTRRLVGYANGAHVPPQRGAPDHETVVIDEVTRADPTSDNGAANA